MYFKSCVSAGLPEDEIEKGKDIKSISEIQQDGNDFKVTVTAGTKVILYSFTVGEECELETFTGEKAKVSQIRVYSSSHQHWKNIFEIKYE